MGETELIQQLKLGETSAYNDLILQHGDRVLTTCYKFLLNKEDAEDVYQEVFIEVFKSINSFKGEAKLSTWIYRIAITKSLDEIKKRNRKKRISSLGKIVHIDEVMHWLGGGRMPDASLKEKEKLQEMNNALNTLPDNQRVAFTLSKIEGYTNPEIAEIMNTSVDAVESLVYRAKKKLYDELKTILKNND